MCLVFSALAPGGSRWRLLVGALALAGLAGAAFVMLAAWRLPFLSYTQTSLLAIDNASAANRLYLLDAALSRAADSPLLGSGFGGFHAMLGTDTDTCYVIGGFTPCGAHNLFVTMAGEAGIVPPVLFLLFLAAAVRARLRSGPSIAGDAAAGWAVVLACDAMTAHAALIASPWNPFFIGAICAAAAHAERSARRGGAPPNAAH